MNPTKSFQNRLQSSIILLSLCATAFGQAGQGLTINDLEYLEMPGLNVMMYHDYYSIGHQSGITIIQNGSRVAANGDIRLWPMDRPHPKSGTRIVNRDENTLSVQVSYSDSMRQQYTDQRYPYPEIDIVCNVKVKGEGDVFRISVDLEKPLPEIWSGKLGFSLELFPGNLFEQPYYMDGKPGTFPRPMNGPAIKEPEDLIRVEPLAVGKTLVIRPDMPENMITIESLGEPMELLDGRVMRNNGWYILRSPLKTGITKGVMEWTIKAEVRPDYYYDPIIQVSQVGYHTAQQKIAVIEMDKRVTDLQEISLLKIREDGTYQKVKNGKPILWGNFLRYKYAHFDFSEILESGIYKLRYNRHESNIFTIDADLYKRHVWQPTLEYYLPVQMCHMRINDRVKVWHGLCHNDDALMAPVSHEHFDGYRQGQSTLCKFQPGDQVPGLNTGGWHDAGDYDLRVESQANTVRMLSFAWELFRPEHDETTVLAESKVVEMHVPDGIPDILQQIEHGVKTVVGGYNALGRLYRGIICPTGRQYSLLGDGSVMTDNLKYDKVLASSEKTGGSSGVFDDRWVFTEENPRRELDVASCLATAYRSLKDYNNTLALQALKVSKDLWDIHLNSEHLGLIDLAGELYRSTGEDQYRSYIIQHKDQIKEGIASVAPAIARFKDFIDNVYFLQEIRQAMMVYAREMEKQMQETPYGVRYQPNIWGDGWNIQRFGVNQYFLHMAFPDIFSATPVYNSLNFVLGVHPGENTASFVSGVGAKSLLIAYGVNRDDWSYIPGGSASGTALIRPDLPELKEWPYLWQQTEYVMGGGATNYMFLVLACDHLLGDKN